ncbi:GPI ethanolamine phosphate transferase 1 [Bradysia coprophila]|uniref:GPI ethanolamine phosphate transferase 1 n=1 Tax=Bradysia coprophila TaxID=38358 RepID=UPI00187D9E7F|nr:GPI ethanolamine phosphate transferase 1 [Bradysia coprophila]
MNVCLNSVKSISEQKTIPEMLKLILLGGVLHLLFLVSIFVIYFQSPIITGLQHQKKILDPPARRLVLFSADGLRAESFYRNGCANTKFLRNIVLNEGIHGISHTGVPTESRTGHVALIAGMYEDPSALFKGWQENPVDFDSVFNRSDTTYAWGSPDILTIFEMKSNNRNMRTFSYDKVMQDFSGSHSTTALDTWVFDNVERFVNARREQLQSDNETVYFLHLLGLDTAGHTHKPNTKLFNDNLIAVDQGVERINKLFNEVFPDDRTAFIFTADHGMTDRGSHGDGDDYETQTPIVAWGAGIPKHTEKPTATTDQLHSIIGSNRVPRFDINQIDIAPLMATLLGIPVPVNSYGQLPLEYLNVSASYTAKAMFHNALQIAEQYKHLRNEFLTGSLSKYLNDYHTFDGSHMTSAEIQINRLLDAGKYDEAIQRSKHFLEQSLNGVEFFQSYYQYWLLTAVALSMIAWICYLVQAPLRTSSKNVLDVNLQINRSYSNVALFGLFLVLVFGYCQSLSISTALIFCAPFVCWLPISFTSILNVVKDIRVFVLIAAVESLVWTFFYRHVVSVLLVLVPIYIVISNDDRKRFCLVNKKWLLTNIILSVFPLLPIVGNNDNHSTELLISGIVLWSIRLCHSLYQNYNFYKMCHLITFTAASSCLLIVHFSTGLNIVCQIVSWICLISAFTLPLLQTTERRLEAVIDGLSIPYLLMSLSYEPIFLLVLSLNLEYFVEMHQGTVNENQSFTNMTKRSEPNTYTNAFTFMLYVMLAFFGTGNFASISSFDPNSVRCFVAVFARALMSVLVVIKLVIPLILVVCAFTGVYAAYKLPMDRIFLAILSICNIMGIHFLFLVTNKGSWLQIGTSISHFVIIETTTVALCALQLLAKWLMETELNFVRAKQRSSVYKFE